MGVDVMTTEPSERIVTEPQVPVGKELDYSNLGIDAKQWGGFFCQLMRVQPEIATDEATMVGWFANAIMAGYEEAQRCGEDRLAAVTAERDALREQKDAAYLERNRVVAALAKSVNSRREVPTIGGAMKTRYLLLLLAGLLLCCHMIGGSLEPAPEPYAAKHPAPQYPSEPLPGGGNKIPAVAARLAALEPVTTSFARFEAANLRAAATTAPISRMDCGPDQRKCVGVMTIPVGCIRSCEGQVLHLRRPDFAGYVGECTIHGQMCVTALNTPFVPGQHYLTFVYRNDSGDLWGAFELWPQEIR